MRSLLAPFLTTRPLARSPITLYRVGLGWLLGPRLLMLEHTGRRSGQPRHVVLEVVGRPDEGCFVVASGFGRRVDWYRNLAADPHCRVSTGRRRRLPATARLLDDADSAARLAGYQQDHPRAWEQLKENLSDALGYEITDIPMVELTLDRP